VTRHFAARKKRISTELCAYLIDITGGTMTALSGEIGKICAYSGADEIVRSDIDAVTEPVLDAVIQQMTDALSSGNYGNALRKLSQLLKMQNDPIYLLGSIGSQFRRISVARRLLDNGRSASELSKLCGMSEYAARRTMDTARRFRPEFCRKASQLILETDQKMKTSYDDPQRLLEFLILQLAQEASHG
jgi:DNA polymerase-3 subunit delta